MSNTEHGIEVSKFDLSSVQLVSSIISGTVILSLTVPADY